MNIYMFELFCCIAEEQSISGAARRAYISQPAVTKNLQHLEEEYGALLVHRQGGSIHLTKVGEALIPHAKAILQEYKNSMEAVQYSQRKYNNLLNVGASYTLGEYVMPSAIHAYSQSYENTSVRLTIQNTPNILDLLEDQEIDIAFVEGEIDNDRLNKEIVAKDEIVLVTAPSHPWAHRMHIVVNELYDDHMVAREASSATRKIIENRLAMKGIYPFITPYMELNTTQAMKRAIQYGIGYGFVSYYSVKQEIESGLLTRIPIIGVKVERPFWCVTKNLRFEKPAIAEFKEQAKVKMNELFQSL